MNLTIDKGVCDVIAVPNPTQYTKIDKCLKQNVKSCPIVVRNESENCLMSAMGSMGPRSTHAGLIKMVSPDT